LSVGEKFKHPGDCGYLDGVHLGVAISRVGDGHHIGLLYRLDDSIKLLHLGWHRDLRDELVHAGFKYLWAPIGLTAVEQVALAGMAAEVSVNVRLTDFRYGLDWQYVEEEGLFDEDEKVIIYPVGKGVTCATFLYGLFKWWGYKLVAPDTWQAVAGDQEWQRWVVSVLGASKDEDSRAQAEALAKDVGVLRLRPEQLAGACATDVEAWPVLFDGACALAAEVVAQVASETARRLPPIQA
jgi:hypothetical protein